MKASDLDPLLPSSAEAAGDQNKESIPYLCKDQ
jgi:hypothetical protein